MAEQVYRIANWDPTFEAAQTRKIVSALKWVGVPTRHDGAGYRRLIVMDDGPALYGAWVTIVQVAAKCPVRGVLANDTGPLDALDLAAKTGMPVDLLERTIKAVCDPKIGWIVVESYHDATTTLPPSTTGVVLHDTTRHDRTGHNRTGQDTTEPSRSATQGNRTEPSREESKPTASRRDKVWCEKFACGVATAMGALKDEGIMRQRRSLYAVARALMDRSDRDARLAACERFALDIVASGGAENKWAVWQKQVNEEYPECKSRRARKPTGSKT